VFFSVAIGTPRFRATESRPTSAFAGQGSGSDEIAGQRNDVRPADLLSPRFEPGLPGRNDIISRIDLAGSLLTGQPPLVSLLPQRGPSIAPVATVVTGGAADDRAILTEPSTDEKSVWPNFVHDRSRKRNPVRGC